jgi:hypothetical protein
MAKGSWAPSQSKLIDALVDLVVRHAPEGWEWAHLEVSMVAELYAGTVTVTTPEKQLVGPISEGKALALLRELRHRMYVAGNGTWFSMTLDIDPDRTATTTFGFDDEPEFDPAPDASIYLRDLQRYKRREAHWPDWLRRKIEETRTPGTSAADSFARWIQGGL